MQYNKMIDGFTMIELIFAIVILGILAGVALPRLAATRDDAEITKGRNDLAAIRSSIVTRRSQQMLSGNGATYPDLNDTNSTTSSMLFGNVLDYPIRSKNASGNWRRNGNSNTSYFFNLGGTDVQFDYNIATGIFDCDHDVTECQDLTE